MSQLLKKTLSGIASVTTILWSVGGGLLALPGAASAATIVAGDLIKASGPAVYYYGSDSKRYVFPNETTYKSWYADFSTVKTITDAELAAIQIGANVTIRPGTSLVKITTDNKVYAVAPNGTLRWIETAEIATALYGANWARRVVDVPDGFFVNYTVGSSVSSAVHPDGTVIMGSGSSDKFVVWGGMMRKLTGDSFMANGLQMKDVIVTTATYPMGADVTGREAAIANTVSPAGTTPTTPAAGTLMVSLASDTPAGVTLPKNAASAQLAKFNLMAGAGAVRVTGLRFHRVGIGATTDFSNVYLYDGNGNRLTTGRTVNSTTNNIEFNSLNLNIAAGQTMSVVLVGDLSSPFSTGGQHSFELVDAASVVVTGGSTVSGSFPVRGNVFTVGTSSAGTITVEAGNTVANPNIGSLEAEIASFKLTASLHDIEVRRVTLLQAGSVSNSDLSDLKLYQGNTLVASAASLMGDKIVLNFVPPYVITNGTSRIFTLKAKIAGRSSRTIRTYVEYSTDVYAVDRTYNTGAAATITSFDGDSGSAASCVSGAQESCVTTQGGQLTVTFNGPTATNLSRGAQDVVLYRFSLSSPESNLEIRNLRFKIASTNNGRLRGNSSTDYFTDIKVKNMANGQTLMGPTSLPSSLSSASDSGTITLSDSFNIALGQVLDLAITADLSNSQDSDNGFYANGMGNSTSTYKVTLGSSGVIFSSSDVRITDTGEYLATTKIVPNTSILGNAMTVKSSNLTVSLASNPSSGTVVKNSQMVPAAGFVLTSGSQADTVVTSLTLKAVGDTAGDNSFALAEADDVITGCGLFDGDVQVGQSRAPDSTTGEMAITSLNMRIARGTSKTIIVKCTTDSSVNASNGDRFAVGISSITAQDESANSVTATGVGTGTTAGSTQYAESSASRLYQTVISGGTLTVSTSNLRTSTILVAGTGTWVNMAEYRATAQNEDIRIEKLVASTTGDAAYFTAVAVAQDGAVKGQDILPSGVQRYKTIDFTSSPINVMRNTSVNFNLWAKLSDLQASSTVSGATSGAARTGGPIQVGIGSGITTGDDAWNTDYLDKMNIRAVGIGSGNLVYATATSMGATASGNSFVVRKSRPTITRQSLSTTTLASGQQMDLYKFQVSADAAGAIALKKITFAITTATTSGSSLSLSNFGIREGSSPISASNIVITDRYGNDLEAASITNSANSSTAQRVVVAFDNGSNGGEKQITGSGLTFTLFATVGGTVNTGDQVTVSIDRTDDTATITGYLTTPAGGNGTLYGPHVDTGTVPGASTTTADFVWSDLAEIPHSDAAGILGGSRDWTNGYLVVDLTQSQSLSK